MTDADVLRYEADGPIARLTLNRPDKRNALSAELIERLVAALDRADADPAVRVVSLRGAGLDFSAGADLAAVRRIIDAEVMENVTDADRLAELFLRIRRVDKPVVAIVHGRALAGGCGLATACDLVLAGESARFGYTEIRIGFVAAMVAAMLRREVSQKRAYEMVALGEIYTAAEMERYGIVNRVFPDAELDERAESFLATLAEQSPSATMLTKRIFYLQDGMGFETAIRTGANVNVLARMTEDTRNGITRFLESRRGSR
jgi:methylglutaconyl-CoA hydratase